jgi:O-antigen ligase
MATAGLNRFASTLFHHDRRVAGGALLCVCLAAALVGGLYVALLGGLYALAGAVALVAALLMLRSTEWGLVLLTSIVCLLPFAALPMLKSRLGFTPTFLDMVLVVLLLVWFTRLATRRERSFAGGPLGLPVALFLAFAIFAFALGLGHARPTSTTLRRFVELMLGVSLYFVVVNNVRSRASIEHVAAVIMVAGALAALVAVVLYVMPETWSVRLLSALGRLDYPAGAGVLRYIEDSPDNPMRAIGTSIDPNVLGGLMVLVTGLTVPQLVSERPLLDRRAVGALLAADVLCVYLTFSRSSLGGVAVALLLVALLRYRRLLWLGLVGLVLLLLLPQTQEYVLRMIEGLRGQDLATQMRLGEYKDALTLIGRHPWLGVGFSGAPEIDVYLGVSNVYLLMAEEMGLVGVGFFLLAMASLFTRFWRTWRRRAGDGRLEALLLGLVAAVGGVLAAGVLDHYLFNLVYPHMSILFWVFVGLATAATAMISDGPQDAMAYGQSEKFTAMRV